MQILDFVDPDIDARLEALEREEDALAAAFAEAVSGGVDAGAGWGVGWVGGVGLVSGGWRGAVDRVCLLPALSPACLELSCFLSYPFV